MKIATIVGARPQFIKEGMFSKALKMYDDIEEIIIHTGQHYDYNMSSLFFKEMEIPSPKYNLNIGSCSHGEQTGKMLMGIEDVLIRENPDVVVVYGDTNSTLAGALAASKLYIPVAHVESGFRDYNNNPEEKNRKLTDHISNMLFCATESSVMCLTKEGIDKNVYFVGDIMMDATICFYNKAIGINKYEYYLNEFNYITKTGCLINSDNYFLCTIHREENTKSLEDLSVILNALNQLNNIVVFPLHPRTKKILGNSLSNYKNIIFVEPVGYMQMLVLIKHCIKVITDSGGLMREAFFLKKKCVTINIPMCVPELLHGEWNVIAELESNSIVESVLKKDVNNIQQENYFGKGDAALKMVDIIRSCIN